jgi:hypothetical protein
VAVTETISRQDEIRQWTSRPLSPRRGGRRIAGSEWQSCRVNLKCVTGQMELHRQEDLAIFSRHLSTADRRCSVLRHELFRLASPETKARSSFVSGLERKRPAAPPRDCHFGPINHSVDARVCRLHGSKSSSRPKASCTNMFCLKSPIGD